MVLATLACPSNRNVVSLPIICPANVKTWEATHAILSKKQQQQQTHTHTHAHIFRKPIHSGLILLRGHIIRLLSAKKKEHKFEKLHMVFILCLVREIVAGL